MLFLWTDKKKKSRNLPHVSPMTLWTMLTEDSKVYSAWMRAYDADSNAALLEEACDSFIASVYLNKFSSHFFYGAPTKGTGLRAVLRQLQVAAVQKVMFTSGTVGNDNATLS